jgi:hypothetical protein
MISHAKKNYLFMMDIFYILPPRNYLNRKQSLQCKITITNAIGVGDYFYMVHILVEIRKRVLNLHLNATR